MTRPARVVGVGGALRPASWIRPTSPGGWALLAVQAAGVLVAVTFAVTGIWHTLDAAWSAVRWPWLWTAYAAVPLAAMAVMLRFPDDRPADLPFLTGALALINGFVTAGYALVDGWFWPAAALSATGLAATVAVAVAVES